MNVISWVIYAMVKLKKRIFDMLFCGEDFDEMVNIWNRIGVNGHDVIDPLVEDMHLAAHHEGLRIEFTAVFKDGTTELDI